MEVRYSSYRASRGDGGRSRILSCATDLFSSVCFYAGAAVISFACVFPFPASAQNQRGPQGSFTSSGAPANTAGAQSAFSSSGAPADSASVQAAAAPSTAVPSPPVPDESAKLSAVEEAAARGDLPTLREYVEDTDVNVAAAAFDAYAARDASAALERLAGIIRDRTQLTRLQALRILTTSPQVSDQSLRATLQAAAADLDPLMRQAAREALAVHDATAVKETGPPPTGPGTQGAFVSSGARANAAGAQAAFQASGAAAIPAGPQPGSNTQTGPSPGDETVSGDPLAGLKAVEDAAAQGDLAALRHQLQDTDAAVQAAAFDALSARDLSSAISDLLAIVRDRNRPDRVQALRLMDASPIVDDVTIRGALQAALNDPDPLLREYAAKALAGRDAVGDQ